MNVLLDTNILARMVQPAHPHHQASVDAVDILQARGDTPCIVPQVFYEYWVVATRPVAGNGLGFSAVRVASDLTRLQALFPLLLDTPAVFAEWERLVTTYGVLGKTAHDAWLVAAMLVQGIAHILTFNLADFARYSAIVVLDPSAIVAPSSP